MKQDRHLIQGPLEPGFIQERVRDCSSMTDAGAVSLFLGQVRADNSQQGKTAAIEYSAYEEMAEKAVDEIKGVLINKFDELVLLEIWHSTGLVETGQISLLVIAASAHRQQAFEALKECVEMIKEKLPVWKKEMYSDGSHQWTNS